MYCYTVYWIPGNVNSTVYACFFSILVIVSLNCCTLQSYSEATASTVLIPHHHHTTPISVNHTPLSEGNGAKYSAMHYLIRKSLLKFTPACSRKSTRRVKKLGGCHVNTGTMCAALASGLGRKTGVQYVKSQQYLRWWTNPRMFQASMYLVPMTVHVNL